MFPIAGGHKGGGGGGGGKGGGGRWMEVGEGSLSRRRRTQA